MADFTTFRSQKLKSARDAERLEQQFLARYQEFIRFERTFELEEIVELWSSFRDSMRPRETNQYFFAGWASKRSGFVLSRRHLERANPGYRVSITRIRRLDAPHDLRRDGLLTGFRITATAGDDLDPFKLVAIDRSGRLTTPRPSSEDTQHQLSLLYANTDTPPFDSSGYAFVDQVGVRLAGNYSDLAALVLAHPIACIDVASQPLASHFLVDVRDALRRSPLLVRELDRVEIALQHRPFAPASDLQVLEIKRFDTWAVRDSSVLKPIPRFGQAMFDYVPSDAMLPSPSPDWHTVHNAHLQDGGTVTVANSLLVYEHAADPSLNQLPMFTQRVVGSPVNPRFALANSRLEMMPELDEAILISGRHDPNWYHWMAEYLPRVTRIPISIDHSVPLLVSRRTPVEGVKALRALSARPVVFIDHDTRQAVRRLHLAAPALQVLDTTRVPWEDGTAINPEDTRLVGAALVRAAGASDIAASRRLFLRRTTSHRGLVNEEELAAIAEDYGFESFDPAAMSWQDQVRAFRSARVVIGATGAAMANYQCMHTGAWAIGLTATGLEGFILPAAIAGAVGVKYSSIVGRHVIPLGDAQSKISWIHSDFSIDSAVFERALAEIDVVESKYPD